VFDREKLNAAARTLPEGCSLRSIDREIYETSRKSVWSEDWTSQYPTYEMYREMGLGVAALCRGEIVAGASSYY
jgi:hypothetical protein